MHCGLKRAASGFNPELGAAPVVYPGVHNAHGDGVSPRGKVPGIASPYPFGPPLVPPAWVVGQSIQVQEVVWHGVLHICTELQAQQGEAQRW